MGISTAQYIGMLSRLNHNALRDQKSVNDVARERLLHDEVAAYCKDRGWICLHGSMAHRTHRTVGEPDCLIVADRGRTFLVELKSKTGKLRPEQQALLAWAKHLDHKAAVCRSLADFIEFVK